MGFNVLRYRADTLGTNYMIIMSYYKAFNINLLSILNFPAVFPFKAYPTFNRPLSYRKNSIK